MIPCGSTSPWFSIPLIIDSAIMPEPINAIGVSFNIRLAYLVLRFPVTFVA